MKSKPRSEWGVDRLTIDNLGPIKHADLTFGDLTVLVGQQASGKSILLAALKLLLDAPEIRHQLANAGVVWNKDAGRFFEAYFGEGMSSLLGDSTSIRENGKAVDLQRLVKPNAKDSELTPSAFVIPAQRVMSIRDGSTRWFTQFAPGDPYMLRSFSDAIHQLMMKDTISGKLFPRPQRLNDNLRDLVAKHIFRGWDLDIHEQGISKRLVLQNGDTRLPYLVWSAGQREFVPLLLGLYHLMPAGKVSRRDSLKWAIIEEPEMGLHPRAVLAVFSMILSLVARGYRVVVSTHSPAILTAMWALKELQTHGGTPSQVCRALGLTESGFESVARTLLKKQYRVYLLNRDDEAVDVSNLDPSSENQAEAMLGTLDEYSSSAADVVAEAIAAFTARYEG
jgi:hypothetical protein